MPGPPGAQPGFEWPGHPAAVAVVRPGCGAVTGRKVSSVKGSAAEPRSQVYGPLNNQASALAGGGGVGPFFVTHSSVMAAPAMTLGSGAEWGSRDGRCGR